MSALELFRAGKLHEALEASIEETKNKPAKPDPRDLLIQLLCFAGEFERTDKHLQVMTTQFPDRAPAVALIRQLLRAAEAREQFFSDGRFPEPIVELSPAVRQHLQATVLLRENDVASAYDLLCQADQQRPRVSGTCDGTAFDDLRDVDDVLAPVFEVFTSTGKYAWVPIENVVELTLHPMDSPLDVLWRRASMVIRDGPDGDVYLPQLYVGSHKVADEEIQAGRATEWIGEEGEPVRGLGQRMMIVGDRDVSLIHIKELRVDSVGS